MLQLSKYFKSIACSTSFSSHFIFTISSFSAENKNYNQYMFSIPNNIETHSHYLLKMKCVVETKCYRNLLAQKQAFNQLPLYAVSVLIFSVEMCFFHLYAC